MDELSFKKIFFFHPLSSCLCLGGEITKGGGGKLLIITAEK